MVSVERVARHGRVLMSVAVELDRRLLYRVFSEWLSQSHHQLRVMSWTIS